MDKTPLIFLEDLSDPAALKETVAKIPLDKLDAFTSAFLTIVQATNQRKLAAKNKPAAAPATNS